MPHEQALLIFCEGPHDAAFTRITLEKIFNYNREKMCLSQFPFPFNLIFKKTVKDHVADDLRLDMAKKFFLPDHVLKNKTKLVMIFNYGGSNRSSSVTPFLEKIFTMEKHGDTFSESHKTPEIKYLFMADADSIGSERTLTILKNEFSIVCGKPWITYPWEKIIGTNGYSQGNDEKIFAYIWKHPEHDRGTLENIIEECVNLEPFLAAVDIHFQWNINSNKAEHASSEQAKRTKAAVSLMGQRAKPGSAMSVIVDQGGFLNAQELQSSQSVQALIKFLTPIA